MTPYTQTIFVDDPRGIPGDCMRTAVASLLDLPVESVPHFVLFDAPGAWFEVFSMWLSGRGRRIRPMSAGSVDRECLAIGMSPRDVEHIVVWGPNGLVHDPHPSRAGIEPRQFWAIEPVTRPEGGIMTTKEVREALMAVIADHQACGSCADAPPYCKACQEEADAILASDVWRDRATAPDHHADGPSPQTPRRNRMAESHAKCAPEHVCQEPSGRVCIEAGCSNDAGTWWGPYWCPEHDKKRLDRISASLADIAASFEGVSS